MVADRGKKSKLSDRIEVEDSDQIDIELVLSIEKLQEVQDQLEKVRSKAELYKALDDYNVGDKVLLKIQRGNENLELQNDSILMAKASKAESPPLLAHFLTTWAFSTMILCTICVCFYTLFSFVNLPLHVQDKDAHDINDGPRLQK